MCSHRQHENQRIFLKEKLILNLFILCLKRLVVTSVNVLRTRFVHWTKPLTSSLPLGTLADLARSKSELMAENALLRQQLIILKRQVKRPACTKTRSHPPRALSKGGSGMEANALSRSTRNPAALASGALPPVLEAQVKGLFSQAQGSCGNHRIDQGDGEGESALGR